MMFDLQANVPVQPFLRWAGGKQQLLTRLFRFLPDDIRQRNYIEPFAGAASMLLAIKPEEGILADANESLIRCFAHVRESPDLIATYLREHATQTCEDYYYEVREAYNGSGYSVAQAARFIYLNKTCFNGIYRVNQHGHFNVPYGHKEPPCLPTRQGLRQASEVLQSVDMWVGSFADIADLAKEGDFVYFDPPYPPLNGTSYFTHYTANRFDWDDHDELAACFVRLTERGCLVMMSNADLKRIKEMFDGFYTYELDVIRYITCKNVKHRVKELIITNYAV